MSQKLIDHVPIHQLQYPYEGQNYVFNGCMKFLMECIGEAEAYDYWFFSAVSGDCYVQVFGTNKDKWNICFSQSKFDPPLIKRVFDAIGYDFSYIAPQDWHKDRQSLKEKIAEYIDKGIPVLLHGFGYPGVTAIVGYEEGTERLYCLPEEATDLVPFALEGDAPFTFVFIGPNKKAPPVAEAYRKALMNAPQLMRTPPCPDGDVFFGNDAFEQWANMLESDFYRMSKEDFEANNNIAHWRYYCVYICILATNIFSKRHTTDRALQMNPELAWMAPLLAKEYNALEALENRLREAEGDFNVTYEVLQDAGRCREIAGIMRQFPEVFTRICGIIERG